MDATLAFLSSAAACVCQNATAHARTIVKVVHEILAECPQKKAGPATISGPGSGQQQGAVSSAVAATGDPAHQSSPLPQGKGRGAGYHWKAHEVEILWAVLRSADLTQKLPVSRAVDALGWSSLPDPDRVLHKRVNTKLIRMRYRMLHGGETSVAKTQVKRLQNKAMTWRAWIRAAMAKMGGQEFTTSDLGAVLEADPDISPLLDRRPYPAFKKWLRWQSVLSVRLQTLPGVAWTGRKRGKYHLYRYDPRDPTAVPATRRRQPKKGVPGLPHLGRHEGSKGDAGQQPQQEG